MIPKLIIAGITNLKDAQMAMELGADGISFIFYDDHRQIPLDKAEEISRSLPPCFATIGEFNDKPLEKLKTVQRTCRLSAVRISGTENQEYYRRINARIIKVYRLKPGIEVPQQNMLATWDFNLAYRTKNEGKKIHLFDEGRKMLQTHPFSFVSGKVNLEVINEILRLNPYGIRVNSGAELFIGKKDPRLISELVKRIKSNGVRS